MGCCDATLSLLLTIIVCTNSVYALASLFLPKVFEEKDIPGLWVGLIFAMYSIAGMLISPFIGTILHKMGSANLIATGLIFMGLSILPIGYLAKIESNTGAVAFALFLRAVQGIASAVINTTNFGMAANKYADKTLLVMGLLEAASGVGLIIGLMGGSVVYESLGYDAVFFAFGGLLLVMAIVSRLIFSCLEKREAEAAAEQERQALLTTEEVAGLG